MSSKLDALIDKYVREKEHMFSADVPDDEKVVYINAIKKQLADEVRTEIRVEVAAEAIKEAQLEIEKNSLIARIKEYKRLSIDGLLIAFFVGMLVNQSTDLVSYFKGVFQSGKTWITIVFCIVLAVIVTTIFFGMFFEEAIKLLGKGKNESD